MTTELNIPLIRQLQEHLRAETRREAFNMADWINPDAAPDSQTSPEESERVNMCGTSACLAGHVVLMHREAHMVVGQNSYGSFYFNLGEARYSLHTFAQKQLGLDYKQARQLFLMQDSDVDAPGLQLYNVTTEQACAALDNLIAHGDPLWKEIISA